MVELEELNQNLPANSTLHSTTLPKPSLQLDLRMCVQLEPLVRVGSLLPSGGMSRNWISFKGGHWSASWGSGTVKPGGQDSQLVMNDDLSTFLETRYLLETNDGAFIVVKTEGWRTGERRILEKLFDPEGASGVDPSEYSFRLFIKLETGDERYRHLNYGMWVGSGARFGREVVYDAFRVV